MAEPHAGGGLQNLILGQASSDSLLSVRLDYDSDGLLIFRGRAASGRLSSEAKWQIQQFSYDSSSLLISILWANGSGKFNQIWDNRASLSYS